MDSIVTLEEVNVMVDNLNNKTTSGADNISNKLLKKTGLIIRNVLKTLRNNLYYTDHTPEQWKFALVAPISKSGKDPREATSYRPISFRSNVTNFTLK